MKQLILKWILSTSGIIIIILLCLFTVSKFRSCTENKSTDKIGSANIDVFRAFIVDSTLTSSRDANNAWRDSVILSERKKIQAAQSEGQRHKLRADNLHKTLGIQKLKTDSLIKAYRNDTTDSRTKGEDAIESLQNDNDSLSTENDELRATNKDLEVENASYSRALFECGEQRINDAEIRKSKEALNDAKDKEIAEYKKAQSKGKGFFAKAEKWIFGVAGAVITLLAIK